MRPVCNAAVQGLPEVVTIDGEFLWALLGAEDIHHLAKTDHMHRRCSQAAAVDIGHVWKHQLLTLYTACAHSFALDHNVLIASPGACRIALCLLIVTPGMLCTNLPMLIASPGIACIGLPMLLGLTAFVFLCSMRLLGLYNAQMQERHLGWTQDSRHGAQDKPD